MTTQDAYRGHGMECWKRAFKRIKRAMRDMMRNIIGQDQAFGLVLSAQYGIDACSPLPPCHRQNILTTHGPFSHQGHTPMTIDALPQTMVTQPSP